MTEISVATYLDLLSDLTPVELDLACKEAMRTSEFMPVVATIRNALKSLQAQNSGEYLGPPALSYPDIPKEEREAAIAEAAEFTEKLKRELGLQSPSGSLQSQADTTRKQLVTAGPARPISEQKKILEQRGLLTPGATHNPKCLCPECRRRRERS